MKKIGGMMVSILIPEVVGILSALLSFGTIEIYQHLNKPSFSPPGWIFGPVWTILYAIMGYASYRVWKKRKESQQGYNALLFYTFQLVFNFLWTILFFNFQWRGIAFIEIFILWALILMTTYKFYKVDKKAGYLFLPYIAWVSFAAVLNYMVWFLNR